MTHRATALGGLAVLFLIALPALASAQTDPDVPPALEEWVDWALFGHDNLDCPIVAGARTCAWPGELALRLDEAGGTFALSVQADRELNLALPGDEVRWPRDVTLDGQTALLVHKGATPHVQVPPGSHVVRGRFVWSRLPESLPVPGQIALLDVRVAGQSVAFPRRQADGTLWLQGGRTDAAKEDRLAIEVHRRLDDGVPVLVTTRLRLRVSGKAREVDLGVALPAGTEPISLNSTLPARLDAQGHLRVQLRPGDQTVTIRARSTGPVAELAAPTTDDRWPEEEIWVFSASPAVRAVRLEGAPGVDPQRTSLDEDWRSLPAWRIARGGSLKLVELRRGEAEPPPDTVNVDRELWLVDSGKSFIVRDNVGGTLNEGGRLELLGNGELGHVRVGSQDRVIGHLDGGDAGVEVRSGALTMVAELAYPAAGALPAVGWNRDASRLTAQLNLPPGWSVLATTGVDVADGTWIDAWSLLDLFFLLLIALVTWKVMDLRWGALALIVLGLAWHEPICPQAWWLVLLATHALIGALSDGVVAKVAIAFRWVFAFGLALQVLVFSWNQITTGVFPQLEHHGTGPYTSGYFMEGKGAGWGGGPGYGMGGDAAAPSDYSYAIQEEAPAEDAGWELDESSRRPRVQSQAPAKKAPARSSQVDPQAVVQTGPGLPKWKWNTYALGWNGPVAAGHELRLILLPPWADLLLSILRVLGLVALMLRFCDPRRNQAPRPAGDDGTPAPPPAQAAAAVAALALMLIPTFATAEEPILETPGEPILRELTNRLAARPDCGETCIEVPSIELTAGPGGLRVDAEVHAQAAGAFIIPGPDTAWMPTSVTIDGRPTSAVRRLNDRGYLAVRVEAGIHRVIAQGPARDEVALQFSALPRVLSWAGEGWAIDGYRADAAPPQSVRLSRSRPLESVGDGPEEADVDLPPWLELRRELDLGIPWLVHNELVRLGPAGSVVRARVPLLPGESVTSAGIPIEGEFALVTLEANESSRAWDSTLADAEQLVLTAPENVGWTERWELDCAPIWSCSAAGLAPVRHMEAGRWSPAWLPWPGESVTLDFGRPTPSEGATSTMDEAKLELHPGRRVLESVLTFTLRSSQGGEQSVTIPSDGQVTSFTVDGVDLPIQAESGKLTWSAEPGAHSIAVRWRQDLVPGVTLEAPQVTLSSGGANVLTTIDVPDNKWLLWAGGPSWGAVVTLWQSVLVLLLAAFLLGRYAPTTEVKTHDWFILGLGMTQVPIVAPVVVVIWLIAVGLRGKQADLEWWRHNLLQVALVGLTGIALLCMYWAVYEGLLFQPDMQVDGAGSYGSHLAWYQDRTAGEFVPPWVLWLPLWVWRVVMLVWALWLAGATFKWVRWAWRQGSVGGLWKMPVRPAAEAASTPPDPDAA
ncbi:MAG: hypothetical protein GY898_08055 [Proteobacteria bacterium]|nr:hypothetical protein [Pseudomonadota bacterium]